MYIIFDSSSTPESFSLNSSIKLYLTDLSDVSVTVILTHTFFKLGTFHIVMEWTIRNFCTNIARPAKPCRIMRPDSHLTGYFIVSSVESAPEIWLNFNKWYFNYKYDVMCSGDKCADIRRLHLTPGNIWTSMWLLWNRADGSFVLALDNIRV